MRIESLQAAADLLSETRAGDRLKQRLEEFQQPLTHPRVILLVSAINEFEKAFPEGLKLRQDWVQVDSQTPASLMNEKLMDADLIIWVMSALKMFPGDHALALETARNHALPIWVVIVGLEQLGDRETFLSKTVADHQALLPAYSEILPHIKNSRPDTVERLCALLEEGGEMLAHNGRKKREELVASELNSMLLDARTQLRLEFSRSSKLLQTAEYGIQSLQLMTEVVSRDILSDYQTLSEAFQVLVRQFEQMIRGFDKPVSSEQLQAAIDAKLREWETVTLEADLAQRLKTSRQKITSWCEQSTEEMQSLFAPFKDLLPNHAEIMQTAVIDSASALRIIEPQLSRLAEDVIEKVNGLRLRIDKDFYLAVLRFLGQDLGKSEKLNELNPDSRADSSDQNPDSRKRETQEKNDALAEFVHNVLMEGMRGRAEKERWLSLLYQEVEQASEAVAGSIKGRFRDLQTGLFKIIQERGQTCLARAASSVNEPRMKMKKMLEAERQLKK